MHQRDKHTDIHVAITTSVRRIGVGRQKRCMITVVVVVVIVVVVVAAAVLIDFSLSSAAY